MRDYLNWMRDKALPLWADSGFDAGRGRFHERLAPDASPLDVPHRAMLQSRQIYVYAHAAHLGWFPEGGRLAEAAMRSLVRDFCEKSGNHASFAFSIDGNGRIVSSVRDTYAHCFVLFAIAWLYRLNGDRKLLDLADEVIVFIDEQLADPEHSGLFDQWPANDRTKRQNPHMHLLEAYLALDHAAPGGVYLERAGQLVELFKHRLFDRETSVLLEHFAQDWSDHPEPAKQQIFEPGHHFEWAWLLREYEKRAGDDLGFWTGQLYASARMHGISERGLIFDEVASDKRVVKRSHRLWPHTEALKAAAVRHIDGDAGAFEFGNVTARVLATHFLDRPFEGGWTDQIGEHGEILVNYVPASSLYHLFLGAAEIADKFDLKS